jgi:DNA-binding XRE family transcriptional regulator
MAGIDGSGVRLARERFGLTQAELAERAGISRQVVVTIETGRHVPSVDAALRLARCLGAPVEDLFAPQVEHVEPIVGAASEGDLVVAGRVDGQVVVHRVDERDASSGAWVVADGQIEDGLRLFPTGSSAGLVVVGCDPALGIAAHLLAGHGERRLVAVSASTGVAVDALRAGRCHGILVHGPEGALPPPPCAVQRWHLARWQIGVGMPRTRRIPSIEAALAGGPGLVQRESSASSQQGLVRVAARLGTAVPAPLRIASGHLDAARTAALLGAGCVTFEPASRTYGLSFVPLEIHVVELWVAERFLEHPGLGALGELIASPAFQTRLAAIGGYDLVGCGSIKEAA